jgi:hypothetical protein
MAVYLAEGVVVIGVSFPGSGLDSAPMSKWHRKRLKAEDGGFESISAQQWQVIDQVIDKELAYKELPLTWAKQVKKNYEYVLASSSMGASNAVGMLATKPEDKRVRTLGLVQDPSLEARSPREFRWIYATDGNKNFDQYAATNPYSEYPDLGPSHVYWKNALRRPASHLGAVVIAMARGQDVEKIVRALDEREIKDFSVAFAYASRDRISSFGANVSARNVLRGKGMQVHDMPLGEHYHGLTESLANWRYITSKIVNAHQYS